MNYSTTSSLKSRLKKDTRVKQFDSLAALGRYLDTNKEFEAAYNEASTASENFTGTPSLEAARELLKTGSPEIMAGLKKAVKFEVDKLKEELMTKPIRMINDVEGLFFDVAKVVEGEPEAWIRKENPNTIKPRVEVVVAGNYRGDFPKEKAIKNAAKIIALIKAIEDAGVQTALTMIFCSTHTGDGVKDHTSLVSVKVKDFDESFNWNKTSAMLHPSFFRRLVFRCREIMYGNKLRDGYGRSPNNFKSVIEGGENILVISDTSSIRRFKNALFSS